MELMLMGRYRLLIIKIFGELDQHKASSVRENADRELGRTGAVNVAFNFENVTFMDSSGIGVIMGRYTGAAVLTPWQHLRITSHHMFVQMMM